MKSLLNKYKGMGKEAKAGLWFIICNFLQKGIAFVTIPMFTRMMSTEQYGLVTLFNTWSALLIIFATLNISGSVYSRGLIEYDQKKFTSITQTISTMFSIILLFIIVIFKDFFVKVTGLNFPILLLMCIYFIFSIGLNLWSVKERFNYRYKKLVTITLLNTALSTICAIIAVYFSDNKGETKIIVSTLIMLLITLPFYIKNYVEGKKFFDKKIWKYVLCFALPLVPHYLSYLVLGQSDKIMINYFCGKTDVALYGVAYSLESILLVFIDAITATLTPWRYKNLKEENYEKINNISLKILVAIAGLVIIVNLFAPEILYIFASSEYKSAVWAIPPIMLSAFYIFLYGFYSSVEFYFLETKFMMIASSISAIVNIILNYLLINKFGYIVCAYTTVICYILYCICHYIYMNFVCKKNIGNKKIYNNKKILCVAIVCSIITEASLLLYKNFILRYIIIAILFAIVILLRKKIISMFNEVKKK